MTPCIHHGFPDGGLSAKFCWAERASMMAVAVQSKDQKNADTSTICFILPSPHSFQIIDQYRQFL